MDSANPQQYKDTMTLMDIIDGQPPGKCVWIGLQWIISEFKYIPTESDFRQHPLTVLGTQLFKKTINHIQGLIFGTGLRRVPSVPRATWGLLLHWNRQDRSKYHCSLVKTNVPHKFTNDFQNYSTVLFYSYDHHEDDYTPPAIEWDDISSIMKPESDLPQQPHDMDYSDSDNDAPPDNNIPPHNDLPPDDHMPQQPPAPPDEPKSPPRPPRPPSPNNILTPTPFINRPPSPITERNKTYRPLPPLPPFPSENSTTPSAGSNNNPLPTTPQPETTPSPSPRQPSPLARKDNFLPTPDTPADPLPKRQKRTDTDSNDGSSISDSPPNPPDSPPNPRSTSSDALPSPPLESSTSSQLEPVSPPNPPNSPPFFSQLHEPLGLTFHQLACTTSANRTINNFHQDFQDEASALSYMARDLSPELQQLFTDEHIHNDTYYYDINTNEVFRIDQETGILTDSDYRNYSKLVLEADRRELSQFVEHKVFLPRLRSSIDFSNPANGNLVDCTWIRRWKIFQKEVKSRMCARGCFDRQKYYIERHSSTATRLSQRMILSSAMLDGYVYDDGSGIDIESLDISCAFLQGFDYKTLEKFSKSLGYESRTARKVFVIPPENVWSHFRHVAPASSSFHVKDSDRSKWILECLRAMYGFADAPLMFQLALQQFLQENEAIQSILDENYLFWVQKVNDDWKIVLIVTAHVDDLQVLGSLTMRRWLRSILEKRFGKLKQQTLPYTHAGIQLERLSKNCLFAHQDAFCSKLTPTAIPRERVNAPESDLDPVETTTFRSLTCAGLWATQTRLEEMCSITSLQSAMKTPKVKDLMAINTVIKRLRKQGSERYGIYFRRLYPPFRVVTVSDAAPANKKSSFATEGTSVLIMEDVISELCTDKDDFVSPELVPYLGGKAHILVGSSQKSKRISHSTSHAETHAAAKIIPVGQIVSLRLGEAIMHCKYNFMLTARLLAEITDTGALPYPCDHYIECMDLWELSCGMRGIPQDKSQRLGILSMREERRSERLRRLLHVRTKWRVCDYLTKREGADSKSLLELLSCGIWSIDSTLRCRERFGATETLEG